MLLMDGGMQACDVALEWKWKWKWLETIFK